MNTRVFSFIFIYTLCFGMFMSTFLSAETGFTTDISTGQQVFGKDPNEKRVKKKKKRRKKEKKNIYFHYDEEPVVDIINFLAQKKEVNVILPLGANQIKSTLTLYIEEPLTLSEAWNTLQTILDVTGYSMLPKGEDLFAIVPLKKGIEKEAMPTYINTPPDELPDSDVSIRYMYYLANLKTPTEGSSSDLQNVLKEVLPATATHKFDAKTNALILTGKSNDIKGIMKIIREMDKTTFQEKLEIIQLQNTQARVVAQLFEEQILKTDKQPHRYHLKSKKDTESSYFAGDVKIMPENRTNKLIILGRAQAVDRLKDFIFKYIDVELESGKSVLHVYELLYLDAAKFEGVLRSILEAREAAGPQQATAEGVPGGINRFFEGVIVKADRPTEGSEQKGLGSNKLIIGAKNEDWRYIRRLIEELDKPQPQVIIEVLVADLTIDDTRQIGGMIRGAKALPFGGDAQIQAAHIGPIVLDNRPGQECPGPLDSDLLARTVPATGGTTVSVAELTGPADAGEPGATLFSFNDNCGDGKTWGLLQLLQLFNHTKIVSHPHVIAINNKEARVLISEDRLLTGESTATGSGTITNLDTVSASLEVKIKPRISAPDHVTLAITITINEFKTGTNTIITREMTTNAHIKSNDILALGGLSRTGNQVTGSGTPILEKIPILGWFFKRRRGTEAQTNLTVFLSPTIILPRLRGGINEYTKDYIRLAERYALEGDLFRGLRDPITRFFFQRSGDVKREFLEFLSKDEFKKDLFTDGDLEDQTLFSNDMKTHDGEHVGQVVSEEIYDEGQTQMIRDQLIRRDTLADIDVAQSKILDTPIENHNDVMLKRCSDAVTANDTIKRNYNVSQQPVQKQNKTDKSTVIKVASKETRAQRLRDLVGDMDNPFLLDVH